MYVLFIRTKSRGIGSPSSFAKTSPSPPVIFISWTALPLWWNQWKTKRWIIDVWVMFWSIWGYSIRVLNGFLENVMNQIALPDITAGRAGEADIQFTFFPSSTLNLYNIIRFTSHWSPTITASPINTPQPPTSLPLSSLPQVFSTWTRDESFLTFCIDLNLSIVQRMSILFNIALLSSFVLLHKLPSSTQNVSLPEMAFDLVGLLFCSETWSLVGPLPAQDMLPSSHFLKDGSCLVWPLSRKEKIWSRRVTLQKQLFSLLSSEDSITVIAE